MYVKEVEGRALYRLDTPEKVLETRMVSCTEYNLNQTQERVLF